MSGGGGGRPRMGMKYRCPICGKMAVAGRHFCSVPAGGRVALPPGESSGEESDAARTRREKRAYIASAIVASALIVSLLWGAIGPASLGALVLAPLAYAGYAIATRLRRRPSPAYLELLLMVGRDRATAERLISAEKQRNGSLDREGCVRAALDRLGRDARR